MAGTTLWHEIKRQSVHFSALVFVIISYFVSLELLTVLILSAAIIAATFLAFRPHLKKIPVLSWFSNFFYQFVRQEEKERKMYLGAATFLVGLLFVLVIFQSLLIFRIAALVLILGDSFSTIFGKAYGKHKIPFSPKKSWEGSFAGFAAAYVGCLFLVECPLAVIFAAIGMAIETLPSWVNDNLTIPLITGFVAWILLA
jgi:dolichol kinase